MVRNTLAFVTGVIALHVLPELPEATAAWIIAGACWVPLLAARPTRAPSAAALAGFLWAWGHAAARLAADLPPALEGRDIALSGCVVSLPEQRLDQVSFALDVDNGPRGVPHRLELIWYRPAAAIHAGECLEVIVRLRARRGFANPGGSDYEAWLLATGIGATGYIRRLLRRDERRRDVRSSLLALRESLSEQIGATLAGRPGAGIVRGLAVGDRQGISSAQWRALSATGTTHLMAISGLHVGIVAGLAFLLGRLATRWRGAQPRRIAAPDAGAAAALLAGTIYAALAGFSLPTIRALVMLAAYLLARWQRRHVAAHAVLILAAGCTLLVEPFAPLAAGAWLSFGAVAVIHLGAAGQLLRCTRIRSFLRAQWSVTLGLLPILATAFGAVSTVAPLANLLAVPLFTLCVIPLVLAGAVLVAVAPGIAALLLTVAAWLIEHFMPCLDWLAANSLAQIGVPALPMLAVGGIAAAVLVVLAPGPWPLKAIAAVAATVLLVRSPPPPPEGTVELAVLDVGQGLAVVVRTRTHVLVYDTGPAFRSGRDTGALVLVPYLRAAGIRRLDMVVASHGDADHTGGLVSVVRSVPAASIVSSGRLPSGAPVPSPCAMGQHWNWDAVRFRFLHPGPDLHAAASDNDRSCVLEISTGAHSVLLPGDIEAGTESRLVREERVSRVDVLVAPHHGSRTSSSPAFVAATRPALVVFASGHRNRWGFPHPAVVRRWREQGAVTLTTAASGAVIIRMDAGGVRSIHEFRREHSRYWRAR